MAGVTQKAGRKYWTALIPTPGGGRVERSTGVPVTASKKKALKRAWELERKLLAEGAAKAAPQALTVDLVLTGLRETKALAVQAGSLRPATLRMFDEKAVKLVEKLGANTDVHKLNLERAEAYVAERLKDRVSLHTIAKELGALRQALGHAKKRGRYKGDPSTLAPEVLRNPYKPRDRWLTREEYRVFRAALAERWRDAFDLGVWAGLRRGEIWALRPEDVLHGPQPALRVPEETKTGYRVVPLAPVAYDAARRLPIQGDVDAFNRALRDTAKRLHAKGEIAAKGLSANDLRRTFASWACNAGVPELTVQKLLGHRSSVMVRRVYAQLSAEHQADAVATLVGYADAAEHPTKRLRAVE